MSKNGIIALLTPAIESFDIPADTIKQIPRGGVSIPIARFVTTTTPICTGSIPINGNIGIIIGTRSIKETVVSINVPAIRSIKLINRRSRILLLVRFTI